VVPGVGDVEAVGGGVREDLPREGEFVAGTLRQRRGGDAPLGEIAALPVRLQERADPLLDLFAMSLARVGAVDAPLGVDQDERRPSPDAVGAPGPAAHAAGGELLQRVE
jgi:hypothetical protein